MADPQGEPGRPLDESGLAALFAQHRDRLWRTVRVRLDRRLVGRVDPDDVLQEAFLDASKRVGHYRPESGPPFLWLRMIVGQTLADTHRRHLGTRARDAGREVAIAEPRGVPDATSACLAAELVAGLTSPSVAAMRAELAGLLESALEAMDPIDREVLVLRHFEELTNGEAAQVLGITGKAASIRYVRAAARLKTILARIPDFADGGA